MADFLCYQCGAQFMLDTEGEAEGGYCPNCGTYCSGETCIAPATDIEVIDVNAEPVGSDSDPINVSKWRFKRTYAYRGSGAEGQGCCCLGCFVMAFLVFLLLRGLLSLLGLV